MEQNLIKVFEESPEQVARWTEMGANILTKAGVYTRIVNGEEVDSVLMRTLGCISAAILVTSSLADNDQEGAASVALNHQADHESSSNLVAVGAIVLLGYLLDHEMISEARL
jgi:TctA family transporter